MTIETSRSEVILGRDVVGFARRPIPSVFFRCGIAIDKSCFYRRDCLLLTSYPRRASPARLLRPSSLSLLETAPKRDPFGTGILGRDIVVFAGRGYPSRLPFDGVRYLQRTPSLRPIETSRSEVILGRDVVDFAGRSLSFVTLPIRTGIYNERLSHSFASSSSLPLPEASPKRYPVDLGILGRDVVAQGNYVFGFALECRLFELPLSIAPPSRSQSDIGKGCGCLEALPCCFERGLSSSQSLRGSATWDLRCGGAVVKPTRASEVAHPRFVFPPAHSPFTIPSHPPLPRSTARSHSLTPALHSSSAIPPRYRALIGTLQGRFGVRSRSPRSVSSIPTPGSIWDAFRQSRNLYLPNALHSLLPSSGAFSSHSREPPLLSSSTTSPIPERYPAFTGTLDTRGLGAGSHSSHSPASIRVGSVDLAAFQRERADSRGDYPRCTGEHDFATLTISGPLLTESSPYAIRSLLHLLPSGASPALAISLSTPTPPLLRFQGPLEAFKAALGTRSRSPRSVSSIPAGSVDFSPFRRKRRVQI
ncbi:hypothetical protein NMY22_g10279 [Coprinellus aureogranulatus]|nr:hypothetical protein NMY22_g10279 [Coprinellus aureogranulatus]